MNSASIFSMENCTEKNLEYKQLQYSRLVNTYHSLLNEYHNIQLNPNSLECAANLYAIGIKFKKLSNECNNEKIDEYFKLAMNQSYFCFKKIVKNFSATEQSITKIICYSHHLLGVFEHNFKYYINAAANFGTAVLLGSKESLKYLEIMIQNKECSEDFLIFIPSE